MISWCYAAGPSGTTPITPGNLAILMAGGAPAGATYVTPSTGGPALGASVLGNGGVYPCDLTCLLIRLDP